MHWVSYTVLADFIACARKGHHFNRADFLDKQAPNGVIITDEMLDAVEMYVADVMQVSNRFDGTNSWVLLEHRVTMPRIHPDNWGTLDNAVLFYDPSQTSTLVIGDLKYGWGIVEAHENWQMINYAAGLIDDIHARGLQVPTFVEFRLCQPRPHHPEGFIRTWTVSVSELVPYWNHLAKQAHEALGPNAQQVPGLHCRYCTGRHACNAFRQTNYTALTVITANIPALLTPEELGAHITLLRRVTALAEAQLSGYEGQALNLIEHGTGVPGWEWDRPDGRLNWTKPINEVIVLGDLLRIPLGKPHAMTPTQAIKAGIPESIVKQYAERKPGTPQLKPANLRKSAAIFGANKK